MTIDLPGARDLAQALHIERAGDGYAGHYAIADVAAFVRPGSALDVEVRARGETLYGVGSKVPLHPPVISEQACSLLPDGPRPALLWTIGVDAAGEGSSVRVERAVVRSRAQLRYDEVQADIDAGRAEPVFVLLQEVRTLRQERERQRGGVSPAVARPGGRVPRGAVAAGVPATRAGGGLERPDLHAPGMAAAHLMTEARRGVLRTLAPADPEDVHRCAGSRRRSGIGWPSGTPYPDLIGSLDPGRAEHAAMLTASTTLLRGSGCAAVEGALPDQPEHSALASTYSSVTAPLRRLVDRSSGEVCVSLSQGQEVPAWAMEVYQSFRV